MKRVTRARQFLRQPEMDRRQPAHRRLLHDAQSRRSKRGAPCRSSPATTRGSCRSTSRRGAATDVPAGPGVKFNPSILSATTSATSGRTATTRGHLLHERRTRTTGRGSRRVVVARRHARRLSQAPDAPPTPGGRDMEPQSGVRADVDRASCRRSVRDGDRFVVDRPAARRRNLGSSVGDRDARQRTTPRSCIRTRRATCWRRSGRRTARRSSSASACSMRSSTDSTACS